MCPRAGLDINLDNIMCTAIYSLSQDTFLNAEASLVYKQCYCMTYIDFFIIKIRKFTLSCYLKNVRIVADNRNILVTHSCHLLCTRVATFRQLVYNNHNHIFKYDSAISM
jgi:hypothetical protein